MSFGFHKDNAFHTNERNATILKYLSFPHARVLLCVVPPEYPRVIHGGWHLGRYALCFLHFVLEQNTSHLLASSGERGTDIYVWYAT